MARKPDTHYYSDRASFDRLMLLIAAIAQSPGIAPSGAAVSPPRALLTAMEYLAQQQGIEWAEWSEATIRKDLQTLRLYGIMPRNTTMFGGYYLGKKDSSHTKKPRSPQPTKATLTPEQMDILHGEGKSYRAIGQLAGVSKQAVAEAIARYRASQN